MYCHFQCLYIVIHYIYEVLDFVFLICNFLLQNIYQNIFYQILHGEKYGGVSNLPLINQSLSLPLALLYKHPSSSRYFLYARLGVGIFHS